MSAENSTSHLRPSGNSGPPRATAACRATGQFKRVDQGRVGFARVGIAVEPATVWSLGVHVEPAGDYPPSPEWVAAAARGATAMVDTLRRRQLLDGSRRITVTEITGSISDTTDDAVACASGLAVCNALVPDLDQPTVTAGPGHQLVVPASWARALVTVAE